MFDKNFSINADEDISLIVDELIYDIYDESIGKNGYLATFDLINRNISHLESELVSLIDKIKEEEKWFKKGIELIHKHRPYREKEDKDEEITTRLDSTYPDMDFNRIQNDYVSLGWISLANMIHYLNVNDDYLKKVTFISLKRNADTLKKAIYTFDRSYLEKERLLDLKNKIIENGIGSKIDKDIFLGTHQFLLAVSEKNNAQKKKPGTKTPSDLIDDIRSILDDFFEKHDKDKNITIQLILDVAKANQMFNRKWVDSSYANNIHPYTDRHLKTLISRELKEKKSSNSS